MTKWLLSLAALALLLLSLPVRAAMTPVVADAETQHYQLELTIGPSERMYSKSEAARLKPKTGEIMVSGHMAPMSMTESTPNGMTMRHLELQMTTKDDGSPVKNPKVSITLINASAAPATVPVAVMYGVDEDPQNVHWGNNVALGPGRHRILVTVNGERATFDVTVPMM